jgi:DNA polymerase-3 subunit delta'
MTMTWYDDFYQQSFLDNLKKTNTHLFLSQQGEGAEYLIEDLIKKLLCTNLRNQDPCGSCPACNHVFDEHPQIRILERSPELKIPVIAIDQVRELTSFIQLASNGEQDKKIIYIKEADILNQSSANALLKNLEEPSTNTYFILNSYNLAKILPTIISRSTLHKLPSPSKKESEDFLRDQGQETSIKFIDLSGNKPYYAIDMSNQTELINQIVALLLKGKNFDMMSVNDNLLTNGSGFFIEILQKWIHDLAYFIEFNETLFFSNLKEKVGLISKQLSLKETLNFYKKLNEYKKLSETQVNKSIALDALIIDYKRIFI